jgi:hypothetical protein
MKVGAIFLNPFHSSHSFSILAIKRKKIPIGTQNSIIETYLSLIFKHLSASRLEYYLKILALEEQ